MSALERLRELEAAATPGPWDYEETTNADGYWDEDDPDGTPPERSGWFRNCAVGEVDAGDFSTLSLADTALITAARNALPTLVRVAEMAQRTMEWGDVGGLLTGDVASLRAALDALDALVLP